MFSESGVKVVFGCGTVGDASDVLVGCSTPEQAQQFFDIFRANGGNELDTARGYSPGAPGTSEPIVGQTNAKEWATISSKVESMPGQHSKAGIEKSVQSTLDGLQQSSFHINYLHMPDPQTPFEETIAAMDAEIRAGKFKHFGLSNFTVDQVREILSICEEKGYTKPTAYQGHYSVFARRAEDELLPLLRKNSITYYAWGPAGGGVFSKDPRRMIGPDGGSKWFQKYYLLPQFQDVMKRIQDYGDKIGTSGHEIALRWILHHSALSAEYDDRIIVGGRTLDQMNSTMKACGDGPLPEDLVALLNEAWKDVEDVAPGLTLT